MLNLLLFVRLTDTSFFPCFSIVRFTKVSSYINILMNLYYKQLEKTLIVNKAAASHDFKTNNRSSRSQMFFKIGVPKNFANFTGKTPALEFFF